MRRNFLAWMVAWAMLAGAGGPAWSQQVPGTGALQGQVELAAPLGQLTVYAYNRERSIGYMVFVVGGRYRVTNVFPGRYEVTLRGTPGQRNWDMPRQSVGARVAAGKTATADFRSTLAGYEPTYVGGLTYPGARVVAYDAAYPPGPGRELVERVCFGCHTSSFYPYNAVRTYPTGRTLFDRDGWRLTVERMANGHAFSAKGKPSYFDPLLLSPREREVLVDYLATNFGVGSEPRAVRQDEDPDLDPAALDKAQFVEYRFPNRPGEDERFTHTPDFDGNGNVWIMDRGGESLVRVDPVAGTWKDHKGHGGGEFLAVDRDGSVWYGGLSHFDPAKDLHDEYKFAWKKSFRSIPISSLVMDSRGDIWLSLLSGGGLGKYDRKADTVVWWDVPIARSRPYGIIVDREDMVWFAGYHNSGLDRFDPATESFRHYPLTFGAPTNIRRPAVDSQNLIWSATWGSRALQNAELFRLDPQTGRVEAWKLGIPFANPYDVEVDGNDRVWIATDNHVLRFDPVTQRFTRYPVTVRTDIPKIAVTRDGAVWFGPRNAGQSGSYGGAATALYPDKDAIRSYAAFYEDSNPRNRKATHEWASVPVKGERRIVAGEPRNPCEFARTVGLGEACAGGKLADDGVAPITLKGGAAHE